MGTSRRDFIKKGSLMAVMAGVPLSLIERTAASGMAAPSGAFGLNKASFVAHLNSTFLINDGASKVAVKLVDVSDLPRRGARSGNEAFSLLFRGDKSTTLEQNTYAIEHPGLGRFSFLIVPIMSKDQSARHYEAIINRLKP